MSHKFEATWHEICGAEGIRKGSVHFHVNGVKRASEF